MAFTVKRLAGPTQLTASAATVYTANESGNINTTIKHVLVANITAAERKFTLSIGADAAGTRLWYQVPVAAYDSLSFDVWVVMNPSETLQAYADAATSLTLTVSGVVTT